MQSNSALQELTSGRSWSFPRLLEQILFCTPWYLHFCTWIFIINPQCCSSVSSGQAVFKEITGRGCILITASDSRPTGKAGRFFPTMGWSWGDRRVNNFFPVQFRALCFRSMNQSRGFLSHLSQTWMSVGQCPHFLGERNKFCIEGKVCPVLNSPVGFV